MSPTSTTEDTRATYWREQIQAWSVSGKSQKAFCEEQALSYHRFGYWRRKFSQSVSIPPKAKTFVAVTRQPSSKSLSLSLPNGLIIEGIAVDNVSLVGQLLRQL